MKTKQYILYVVFLFVLTIKTYSSEISQDILSMSDGQTSVFSTSGHPKANGVNWSIKYPSNWKTKEGNLPKTVQQIYDLKGDKKIVNIFSGDLKQSVKAALIEQGSTEIMSDKAIRELIESGIDEFYENGIKDLGPINIIKKEAVDIAGKKALLVVGIMPANKHPLNYSIIYYNYLFLSGTTMVTISCEYQSSEKNKDFVVGSTSFTNAGELFALMANSIIKIEN
jgi:hypothetical protein